MYHAHTVERSCLCILLCAAIVMKGGNALAINIMKGGNVWTTDIMNTWATNTLNYEG